MKYRVIVEQHKDGSYVAWCPLLPDCMGKGTTADDAIAHVKEQITACLKSLPKQKSIACEVGGCQAEAMFDMARIESRRVVSQKSVCERHAQMFFTDFRPIVADGHGVQHAMPHAVCVDLEMIVYYKHRQDTATPASIYLREVGGKRRICMLVDGWAWFALMGEIKRQPALRPRTHTAWAMTVTELGGELQDVVLDRREGEQWWSANAQILKNGDLANVDARPSDACILALIHNATIFVVERALETFAYGGG